MRPPEAASRSPSRRSAVGGSRCAVGSSSTSTGASERNARASPIRWRCPPESSRPSSPTSVSRPSGSDLTQSPIRARVAAPARAPRRSRPGGPRRTLSRMLVEKRCASWPATAITCAHVLLAVGAQVVPRERHPAMLGIEEAQEQVRDRRLPRPARPDERDPPARVEPQGEAVERRRLAGRVAGAHPLERDRERPDRRRERVGGVGHGRLAVGQLEDAPSRRERLARARARPRAAAGRPRRTASASNASRAIETRSSPPEA